MQRNDGKGDYPFAAGLRAPRERQPVHQRADARGPDASPIRRPRLVYSGQWNCLEQFQSGLIHFVNRIRDRRFVAIDQERGIVFAFGFFDHSGRRDAPLQGARAVARWWPVRCSRGPGRSPSCSSSRRARSRKIDAFLQRCALRHELRLEHLGAGHVRPGARRDDGSADLDLLRIGLWGEAWEQEEQALDGRSHCGQQWLRRARSARSRPSAVLNVPYNSPTGWE